MRGGKAAHINALASTRILTPDSLGDLPDFLVTACSIFSGVEALTCRSATQVEGASGVAWKHIGSIARRLAASVIEQRRKAAEAAELDEDLAAAEAPASTVAPRQARVAGREAGHPLGAQ